MRNLFQMFSLRIFIHLFILRPFVKLIFGINIKGRENISQLDRYIIVANHNSHMDILLLFCILPVKGIPITHPVAAKEYFSKSKLSFYLINFLFSPIWVERGKPQERRDPLKDIKDILDGGHNVIIFPEGTRGTPGEMKHFKSGIGRLAALYHNIPIVPVFLFGPERVLPKGSNIPLPLCNEVIIAPPHFYRGAHTEITHSIEKILQELEQSVKAFRHKRETIVKKSSITIAVLGIDGSGKSTLSRSLAQNLSVDGVSCLVSDALMFYENNQPKDMQPLITEKIREMIGGYAKKVKSLKFYKIPKLTELLLRDHLLDEIKKWYSPDFIILDGAPLLNLTAWACLYKEQYFNKNTCSKAIRILTAKGDEFQKSDPIFKQFPELLSLKYLKLNHLKLPDIVIFLDVESTIACKRIDKRGERKQVHETEEKLGKLREAYKLVRNVILEDWNIPTLSIDGNKTIEDVIAETENYLKKYLKENADGK